MTKGSSIKTYTYNAGLILAWQITKIPLLFTVKSRGCRVSLTVYSRVVTLLIARNDVASAEYVYRIPRDSCLPVTGQYGGK
jgi:hypothetical protein